MSTHALHKTAFDLADVEGRVDGVPTSWRISTLSTRLSPVSVSMATSLQAAAVAEVIKRPAVEGGPCRTGSWCCGRNRRSRAGCVGEAVFHHLVKAARHRRLVILLAGKTHAAAPQLSRPSDKCSQLSRTLRAAYCAGGHSVVTLLAAVARRLGNLAGCRRRCSARVQRHAQLIGDDLRDLGVQSPWPISVPPWFTCTLPSVYTCTSAPAWLKRWRLKLMRT